MAWVRIEDSVTEHRKMLKAGPAACWLWVCGIAYSQRQLTDGFIPDEALPLLGVAKGAEWLAKALVDVRLFERVEGGYQVHDYLSFNDTREEALKKKEEARSAKSRAGAAGAKKRWQKDSSSMAAAKQPAIALPSEGNSRTIAPSPTHPSTDDVKNTSSAPPPPPKTSERVGRLFLHRWQLEALIDALGPHAEGFELDVWLDGLTQKADAQGLTFPTKESRWTWVQAELKAEIERRGLPVAGATPAPSRPRGCKHEPACADDATHTKLDMAERRRAS